MSKTLSEIRQYPDITESFNAGTLNFLSLSIHSFIHSVNISKYLLCARHHTIPQNTKTMPQGAYTLVGTQTHKQIITMEYDLCWKEDVYNVHWNLQINAAQG